ncbi:single-stranded DNA-binding protein [Streptomyces sp. IB2014 016-6]|uniref:single-stranded DNA-binding protein n=1 Tax=Streptomyces sp. IB2014 016-6 TaxID=2517818 RepID=UPI0011CABAF6|nr:single-stranded DNA-binding protein [Streptomyces sp. IB2014 016-6]TXL91620.1 single-stranded DNA-binding protein [Streptomyces sp. IB2014 016-6]
MTLPTMTGVGRLTADPELRFTPSGKAVASVSLAFNSRRKNPQTQEWEDADVFFVRGTAWERLAENLTESLAKGMEVLVTGELRTESWEKDGQKQSRPALLIRSIGPTLAFSVAQVSKDAASQNGGQTGGQGAARAQQGSSQRSRPTQPPQDDPWATGIPSEPPF